jgi:hypothetical protein
MPNDVKAIVSALVLIVAATLSGDGRVAWSGLILPPT